MIETRETQQAFKLATVLLFAFGFITATIDPLIPAVKSAFQLTYFEALLTQFAFFTAYGVFSIPSSFLIRRVGYLRAILFALAAITAGCLMILVATRAERYVGILIALFTIGSGVTLLQVSANPLIAALGDPARAHFRLNRAGAFNSLATIIAPYLGSVLMLGGGAGMGALAIERADTLRRVDVTFLAIAAATLLLLALFARVGRRLEDTAEPDVELFSFRAAFRSPWLVAGCVAAFSYIGAEISTLSLMINFLHQRDILDVSLATAGGLLSLYNVGRMTGRFIGSHYMQRVNAAKLLVFTASLACGLNLMVTQTSGMVAGAGLLVIGLFTSITFPTVFTLTLERSGVSRATASGLLCMSIVGGALVPLLGAAVADRAGLSAAFYVPAVAQGLIAVFAWCAYRYAPRPSPVAATVEARAPGSPGPQGQAS